MTERFGLIGYGLWGRHHARAIAQAPGATLAAIACRTGETAAAARKDWPDAAVELDYRALRAWWSGGMDRTRQANFGLTVRRRGVAAPEHAPLQVSGELFELEEQLRLVIGAFRERRALVSPEEARKAVAVCLAVEDALQAA